MAIHFHFFHIQKKELCWRKYDEGDVEIKFGLKARFEIETHLVWLESSPSIVKLFRVYFQFESLPVMGFFFFREGKIDNNFAKRSLWNIGITAFDDLVETFEAFNRNDVIETESAVATLRPAAVRTWPVLPPEIISRFHNHKFGKKNFVEDHASYAPTTNGGAETLSRGDTSVWCCVITRIDGSIRGPLSWFLLVDWPRDWWNPHPIWLLRMWWTIQLIAVEQKGNMKKMNKMKKKKRRKRFLFCFSDVCCLYKGRRDRTTWRMWFSVFCFVVFSLFLSLSLFHLFQCRALKEQALCPHGTHCNHSRRNIGHVGGKWFYFDTRLNRFSFVWFENLAQLSSTIFWNPFRAHLIAPTIPGPRFPAPGCRAPGEGQPGRGLPMITRFPVLKSWKNCQFDTRLNRFKFVWFENLA